MKKFALLLLVLAASLCAAPGWVEWRCWPSPG